MKIKKLEDPVYEAANDKLLRKELRKPSLNAEYFVADIMARLRANKRVTGIHRMALAIALFHSVGLESKFTMQPKVRMLRAGKLVHINCPHARKVCHYPEHGTFVGRLERVVDGIAIVRVKRHCHIAVSMDVLTEI